MSETRPLNPVAIEIAHALTDQWPEIHARIPGWHPRNETPPGAPPAAAPSAPAGGGEGGDPAGGGESTPAGGGGFDYDRIESMLDQRFQAQDQRIGGLEQRLPQPETPPEANPFADHLSPLGYDDEQIAGFQQVLSPLFQNAIQQATAPLQQTIQTLQQGYAALNNELDAGDLVERYPALGTDEVYGPVAADAVQLAQSLGLQVQRPEEVPAPLVEQVYLARLGRERVASETPAGGDNPGLETAGGATPPPEEPDLAREIVNARGPRTPAMQFWGA